MGQRFCRSCGTARLPGAAFCQACGARLEEAVGQPAVPAPVIPTAGDPILPAAAGQGTRCVNCGRPTEEAADRCVDCSPAPMPLSAATSDPMNNPLPGNGRRMAVPMAPSPLAVSQPPVPSPTPALAPTTQRSGPPRWVWVAGGLLAVALVGGAAVAGASSGHTLTGTVTVYDDSSTGCDLSPGYADLHEGTPVVVTDSDGQVLASSSLDAGEGDYSCEFPFTVEGLPERDVYTIEVSHRGQLSYQKSELETMDWDLSLDLGLD